MVTHIEKVCTRFKLRICFDDYPNENIFIWFNFGMRGINPYSFRPRWLFVGSRVNLGPVFPRGEVLSVQDAIDLLRLPWF